MRNNIALSVWRIRAEFTETDYGLTKEAQFIDRTKFLKFLRVNLRESRGCLLDASAYT